MPKVSVIIPIFGVEKYIERCARSLFEQTLDDIEYIFVDDKTKDTSIDILEEVIKDYPQRIHQIKIIRHLENMGLPQARLTGILHASGEYIIHCDSDDWVDTDMYRNMYELAIKNDADIVLCDFYSSDDKGCKIKYMGCRSSEKITTLYDLLENKISWAVWNKLVKHSLYDNYIIYPQKTNGEDLVLTSQLIFYARKIAYVQNPLYYYFYNNNSITKITTNESILKRFYDIIENIRVINEFFCTKIDNRKYTAILINLKFIQKRFLYPVLKENTYYKLWKNSFKEVNYKVIFNTLIPLREKIKFYLYLFRILR